MEEKKLKKIIASVLCVLLLVASLAGCSGGASSGEKLKPGDNGEVNVCNWGEYIDESIFEDFEAQTGIKINYNTAASNEVLYSLLKSGGADFDVIIPSDYLISRLIDEGMIQKINFDNVPNAALIDEDYKNLEYDPTGEYSVAYMWGTVGIIYNTTMISDEITSWGSLFDPAYAGQLLMIDNPRDAFGVALEYLGYSLNTTSEKELNEAYDLLVKQNDIRQGFVMDQIYDKMEGGEAAISVYYAGDYISMYENNEDLTFVHPVEGANVFVDAMCILSDAKNKENAEAFINFMCDTDIALRNMDVTGYVSANGEAAAIYAEDLSDMEYEVLFPSDEYLDKCEVFLNLPEETLTLYNDLWIKLKT